MTSTLGHFVLFLALGLSLYAAAGAVVGARLRREDWLASSRNAVLAQFCLVTLAIFLLEYALITSDFSLRYVANNSTRGSLTRYKIAALGLAGRLHPVVGLAPSPSRRWWWRLATGTKLMPYVQAVLQGIAAFPRHTSVNPAPLSLCHRTAEVESAGCDR
jgi:hypothetical protein